MWVLMAEKQVGRLDVSMDVLMLMDVLQNIQLVQVIEKLNLVLFWANSLTSLPKDYSWKLTCWLTLAHLMLMLINVHF